jgi:hypothetical protein
MKALLFATAFLTSVSLADAPVGSIFPDMKAESLKDKNVSLPADVKGKFTLICLSWSEDAEPDLQTWYEPAYDKFIAKTGLMDDAFDVNLYFVPMFTGAKASAADNAKKRMKTEVQADIQPHILIYKGEVDNYKDKLKMTDKKKPYIFLLDKEGKIVYATSGAFTEEKMDAIDELIE